jgi:hypothetical protein
LGAVSRPGFQEKGTGMTIAKDAKSRIANLEARWKTLRHDPTFIKEMDERAAPEGDAELLFLLGADGSDGFENVTPQDLLEGKRVIAEDIVDRLDVERAGLVPRLQEIILILMLDIEERKTRDELDQDWLMMLDRLSDAFASARRAKNDEKARKMRDLKELKDAARQAVLDIAIGRARAKQNLGKSRTSGHSIEDKVLDSLKDTTFIGSPEIAAIFDRLRNDLKATGQTDKKAEGHVEDLKSKLAKGLGAGGENLYKSLPKKGT